MTGWFGWMGGSGPSAATPALGAPAPSAPDKSYAAGNKVREVVGPLIAGAAGAIVAPILQKAAAAPFKAIQEAGKRREAELDAAALEDLRKERFDRHRDHQREFIRRADGALDRLEKKEGLSGDVHRGRGYLRRFEDEHLDHAKVAESTAWHDSRFVRHLSPGDPGWVAGKAQDLARVGEGILFHGEFHGPGHYHAERRAGEEADHREKYHHRPESPPPKSRPEVAKPSEPAQRCMVAAPQPPRVYRDDRPRTCSPNPEHRYQEDFPLPDSSTYVSPKPFIDVCKPSEKSLEVQLEEAYLQAAYDKAAPLPAEQRGGCTTQ